MIGFVLLGLCLFVGFLLLSRWFVNSEPKQILSTLKWIAIATLGGAVIFMLVTGRLGWAFAGIAGLFMIIFKALGLLGWPFVLKTLFNRLSGSGGSAAGFGGGAGPTGPTTGGAAAGGSSTVETPFLRMELNLGSGGMRGTVLKGLYTGRDLDDLEPEEMSGLIHAIGGDRDSLRLLESWLDRERPNWREVIRRAEGRDGPQQESETGTADQASGAQRRSRNTQPMTAEQARSILGLSEQDAQNPDAIKAAHRQLMGMMHPDRGGSDFLAAQINQARGLLLDLLQGS
ncbi:MAG: hypothetical protein ACPGOY_08145 [Rhodospirillaceae bacterium]